LLAPVLAAALALAVPGAVPALAASGHPGPSQADILRARHVVATRAGQIAAARRQIAAAARTLHELAAAAETATEAYDGALVRLATAGSRQRAAQAALTAAQARVAAAQKLVDAFALANYEDGSSFAGINLVLSSGGPAGALDRVEEVDAISGRQAGALRELQSARLGRRGAARAAAVALSQSRAAAGAARAARAAALAAVTAQRRVLGALTGAEHRLRDELLAAMSRVQRLQAERAAYLAALRARALARAQAIRLARLSAAAAAALGHLPTFALALAGSYPPATAEQGLVAVKWAEAELGVPYSWGGGNATGPTIGALEAGGITAGAHTVGFDCSGLTLFAWAHAGVLLNHWTGSQWVEGTRVPVSRIRPGDLVFFATDVADPATIHHVGIYVGGGMMINAPETGEVVSFAPAFGPGFVGAVRP
jgi:cell wall-associated NlpC family hydrolase